MSKLLIIDDDPGICHILTRTAQEMGHEPMSCGSLAAGERLLNEKAFDVILLDVYLPDGNGIDAIERLAAHAEKPEIVIITGLGASDDAERAIQSGAWDYIEKSSPRRMAQSLEQVLHYREERLATRQQQLPSIDREGIVGESPRIMSCLSTLAEIASGEANVIITGETGTGKEAFARAVHRNSERRNGPFIVVDCASLPDSLAESILFGFVRGAFTGAGSDRDGLIREADGGTLFLDEVGELPLALQATFLRVLQQKTFRPVGSGTEISSDFRLVAATNRDLDAMAQRGEFRFDLLFRLRGAHLALPPLRERLEDIIPIAEHYIELCCKKRGVDKKVPSNSFLDILKEYSWPGNVRELVNAVDYAVNAAFYEQTLYQAHLPRELRARVLGERVSPMTGERDFQQPDSLPLLAEHRKAVLQKAERHYLEQLVLFTGDDMQAACEMSGLSQSRLYTLFRELKMPTPGWKRSK
ncbi:sigma-54-dependent transcriptional regulator [Halodesulfovibrio aestuarii]|uniref:Sigma-54-dependent transcriptional regulator n=1 Tax=Halodesulfovibrio aestuarii TaxID=126333 RepID=A0ABV4JZ85_9BACT